MRKVVGVGQGARNQDVALPVNGQDGVGGVRHGEVVCFNAVQSG